MSNTSATSSGTDLPDLTSARRIVVKTGSALVIDPATGKMRAPWLEGMAAGLARLATRGTEVVVVSSGAIALGRAALDLGLDQRLAIEDKQAAAATGQIRLVHAWEAALAAHGLLTAQILLTTDDTEDRRRHLNARGTLNALLTRKVVPVINENDTVATAEIRFGDNDRLAARVAQMISADTLVLLSDIDGLYTADPRNNPHAAHIPVVRELTPDIMAMAGEPPPGYSSGGMVTKLEAARIALSAGCRMVIAHGARPDCLAGLDRPEARGGARATWFLPSDKPLNARKKWIAGHVQPRGLVRIDAGAVKALHAGKSLLPAGVVAIEGTFQRGDPLAILDPAGTRIALGLSAWDSDVATRLTGASRDQVEADPGCRGQGALIHRDDLVITNNN